MSVTEQHVDPFAFDLVDPVLDPARVAAGYAAARHVLCDDYTAALDVVTGDPAAAVAVLVRLVEQLVDAVTALGVADPRGVVVAALVGGEVSARMEAARRDVLRGRLADLDPTGDTL